MSHAPGMNMGDQSGMPLYPRPMSTLTDTTLGPARWHTLRMTAAVLGFLAGLLAVIGSFLPLFVGSMSVARETIEVSVTAWSSEIVGNEVIAGNDSGDVPANGYPMVFAGIILVGAAVVCWFAASPGAAAGTHRSAGVTTAVGAGFIAATTWTVSVQVQNGVDSLGLMGAGDFGIETEAAFGVGYWLLLTGALMAATAAVLSLIPVRQVYWPAPPRLPVDPNMATPPYGIVLPTQPPPVAPQQLAVDPLTGEPLHVDPLTGQPYSPPAGTPVYSPPMVPDVIYPVAHDPVPAQDVHYPVAHDPMPAQEPHTPPAQNGAEAVPDIVIPAPPPPPEVPPGPAVTFTEDPLAEPRRD